MINEILPKKKQSAKKQFCQKQQIYFNLLKIFFLKILNICQAVGANFAHLTVGYF